MAIVGAGPTGLALALGLARHGVRSVVIEKDPSTSTYSKAPGIHIRTREIFHQWGVEERLLNAGTLITDLTLYDATTEARRVLSVGFGELEDEADRPGLLILEQGDTERLLLEAVRQADLCDVRFNAEAIGLSERDDRVLLVYREGEAERALESRFVVGCDGASSFVRGALDLSFDGITYSLRPVLADVRIDDQRDALAWPRVKNGSEGFGFTVRLGPGLWRIVHLSPRREAYDDVAHDELACHVYELLGEGPFETVWSSRFRIHRRSSPRFRLGRVLLAGDAAHVHSPVGGMGMNAGIQDAHNLAWKLAAALHGGDPERLLASYEIERQAAVVEQVSRYTDVITRTFLQTPRTVRAMMFWLLRSFLRIRTVRRRFLRRTAMVDVRYPASPLMASDAPAGNRLPNPRLDGPDGSRARLYDLLPPGPALVVISDDRLKSGDYRMENVIRIGDGAYSDTSGILQTLLEGDGCLCVRPDLHIAAIRQNPEEGMAVLEELTDAQLGTAP